MHNITTSADDQERKELIEEVEELQNKVIDLKVDIEILQEENALLRDIHIGRPNEYERRYQMAKIAYELKYEKKYSVKQIIKTMKISRSTYYRYTDFFPEIEQEKTESTVADPVPYFHDHR